MLPAPTQPKKLMTVLEVSFWLLVFVSAPLDAEEQVAVVLSLAMAFKQAVTQPDSSRTSQTPGGT